MTPWVRISPSQGLGYHHSRGQDITGERSETSLESLGRRIHLNHYELVTCKSTLSRCVGTGAPPVIAWRPTLLQPLPHLQVKSDHRPTRCGMRRNTTTNDNTDLESPVNIGMFLSFSFLICNYINIFFFLIYFIGGFSPLPLHKNDKTTRTWL